MSTSTNSNRNWTRRCHAFFFWTGLIMGGIAISLVSAGNTRLIYPLEHAPLPLSWAFAGTAIVQFAVAEICHHVDMASREPKERRVPQPKLDMLRFY